jgi:Flp pilus assembly protein TadD
MTPDRIESVAAALEQAAAAYRDGNIAAARDSYARVLQMDPQHALALTQLGGMQLLLGENDAAAETLRRLAAASAEAPRLLRALYAALQQQGKTAAALVPLREAVNIAPSDPEAHHLLGKALLAIGARSDAEDALRRAVDLDPNPAATMNDLCDVWIEDDKLADARELLDALLARHPDNISVRYKLGYVELLARNLTRATALLQEVARIQPDYAPTYLNLGTIAQWSQDPLNAEAHFRRALGLQPGYPEALENLGMALITQGRYEEGWKLLEVHAHDIAIHAPRPFPTVPAWDGRSDAKTILLVYPEQGLGDTIQFARYFRLARQRVGRILFYVDGYWRPLHRIMRGVEGVDEVIDSSSTRIKVSHTCSLLSLPHLLGLGAPDPAQPMPYLTPHADDVAAWGARLAGYNQLKVGLAWAGNPRPGQRNAGMMDRRRSVSADTVRPLLELADTAFFSLQLGAHADVPHLIDFTGEIHDMADTAGLISQLDLVVSVDTSVVHLVGALAKPIWMLNRYDSCWRWGLGSERTAWYPSMRIFWQRTFGEWAPVIEEVREQLAALRDAGLPSLRARSPDLAPG